MGLSIVSRDLPRDICGLYDDRHRLILLADWLNQRQRRCTLCHELIHARHHDPGCGTRYGAKCERRCRRETALALISRWITAWPRRFMRARRGRWRSKFGV